jgi:DNA-binding transcriptional regulator LsrR (DeoR family)
MENKIPQNDLHWAREIIAMRILPQTEVARQLGISVPTLRRRLKSLDAVKEDVVEISLKHALTLYARLSQQLHDVIARLNDAPEEKGVADLVRLHAKSLLALVTAERSIAKVSAKYENRKSNDLSAPAGMDLELAREEVHRRLARLRQDTQADTGVSGQSE